MTHQEPPASPLLAAVVLAELGPCGQRTLLIFTFYYGTLKFILNLIKRHHVRVMFFPNHSFNSSSRPLMLARSTPGTPGTPGHVMCCGPWSGPTIENRFSVLPHAQKCSNFQWESLHQIFCRGLWPPAHKSNPSIFNSFRGGFWFARLLEVSRGCGAGGRESELGKV